ncbi:MAG: DUF6600 domain-containing protein [Myxococcaceae bacterium]
MTGSLVGGRAGAQDWTPIPPPDGDVQANFEDALSPYGDWVDVDGTRAWRPAANVVGDDFQPYATNGQWVASDYGWYFQSDYGWGWAPFHYGRWAMDANYGWVWVPGTVWAPAWVDWRLGGGYIGWAPLPPIGWSVVVQPWRPYWCFVPAAHFAGNFWSHRLPVENIHYAYAATSPVHQAVAYGGARWYAGPPVAQVERLSAQPIQRVAGNFTPPAPGRIQPIQLQPPRGYSGGPGAVRNAAAHQSPPPPSRPPPAPSHLPPPSTSGHSAPRGAYSPTSRGAPAIAETRVAWPEASGAEAAGREAAAASWSGSMVQHPTTVWREPAAPARSSAPPAGAHFARR